MAGPTLYRPSSITSGLQGYWKLDEASGDRADSSGNANTLTDTNTVLSAAQDYWKTGENSADFETSNSEYLTRASASCVGLNITGTYSFCAFIKVESAAIQYLMAKWAANSGYAVGVYSDGSILFFDNKHVLEFNVERSL